ncbi:MAG: DUF4097 family beta strand repeat-containing protein [Bryobacteraceae bacterium]|jgi:hypothetical protein
MSKKSWWLGAACCALLWGQDAADRVTVPFRDPSRPGTLRVDLINGSVTVRGYDGKDAIIESTGRSRDRDRERNRSRNIPDGMHRIDNNSSGLDIVEDNNIITIKGGFAGSADVVMQVPRQTSLNLKSLNGGKILVENIAGEIDAENLNGSIEVTNASGAVVAHSQNGKITVSLNRVTPNKSMSFVTMNGTVDVSLPADVKANLRMKTENGEIWSDFDIKLDSTTRPPVVDDQRRSGGRYRVRIDKSTYGTINGGGPELIMQTFNGSILIHKK